MQTKNLLQALFITALYLTIPIFAVGQSAVIYNFAFRIDDELITQTKAQNKDYKILNLATVEDMPKETSDTILIVSEVYLNKLFNVVVSSMVSEEKLIMGALPEHLMYLPANTLNKAIKNGDHQYYININCHIAASGGTRITFGTNSYSRVKPKVTLSITASDKNKNVVFKKEVVVKDFEKLRSRSFEKTYGVKGLVENTDEVTVSETLTAYDILKMYLVALENVNKI
jgi:hypothetical protein